MQSTKKALVRFHEHFMHFDALPLFKMKFLIFLTKIIAKIIPIIMEPELHDLSLWKGPVGLKIGSILYQDFSEDTIGDAKMDQLVAEIKRRL